MNDCQGLLDKAARSLEVAEDLLQKGHIDFAASRAYYALFYTAQALLLSRDLEFSSHGQVVAQYGRHFSKTGILDTSFHHMLAAALDLRHLADYQTEIPIEPEMVEPLIGGGRRFLEAASRYLDELQGDRETSGETESGESGED
jgi:uncharacterized protein